MNLERLKNSTEFRFLGVFVHIVTRFNHDMKTLKKDFLISWTAAQTGSLLSADLHVTRNLMSCTSVSTFSFSLSDLDANRMKRRRTDDELITKEEESVFTSPPAAADSHVCLSRWGRRKKCSSLLWWIFSLFDYWNMVEKVNSGTFDTKNFILHV